MPRRELAPALRQAAERLREAGVPSPEHDSVALAAHVLGVDAPEVRRRALIGGHWVPTDEYLAAVDARASRVPLQHITGRAPFRTLDLEIGPGAFVPRPETETLVELALAELTRRYAASPPAAGEPVVVVDLCSGAGPIPLALLAEAPGLGLHELDVHAVEVSSEAMAWLVANSSGTGLHVHQADATAPIERLEHLRGQVPLVTCNPPYIPEDAVPVDPEVAEHDPEIALYGGSEDGLRIPREVALTAYDLVEPGGLLLMEHAAAQGETLPAALRAQGWTEVRDHEDLTGRPRVTAARKPLA